jgi:hypothetical protein
MVNPCRTTFEHKAATEPAQCQLAVGSIGVDINESKHVRIQTLYSFVVGLISVFN